MLEKYLLIRFNISVHDSVVMKIFQSKNRFSEVHLRYFVR